jgi:hypothetical protein
MMLTHAAVARVLQEIQESSTSEAPLAAQQPHPSQVLQQFWNRNAAAAAGSNLALAPSSTTAGTATSSEPASSITAAMVLPAAVSGLATGPLAAALGQQPLQPQPLAAAVSRYRSDFQELNRLGQGGFGVVVAAVNRWAGPGHVCVSVLYCLAKCLSQHKEDCFNAWHAAHHLCNWLVAMAAFKTCTQLVAGILLSRVPPCRESIQL